MTANKRPSDQLSWAMIFISLQTSWTFNAGMPVRIELCDLQGKAIAVAEGTEIVVVDAANLPSGIYIARIHSGETVVSQRVTKR